MRKLARTTGAAVAVASTLTGALLLTTGSANANSSTPTGTLAQAGSLARSGSVPQAGMPAQSGTTAATVRPCTINNISFFFGGFSAGVGQRQFQLTLLAHDGITCTLSDTPLIKLAGPPDQTKPIPLDIGGRGGTLTLSPQLPLHATFYYAAPDTTDDTIYVSTLTLSMPDGTSRTTDFLYPGNTAIYSGGVSISSWTTGIGLGEGEEGF